MARVCVKEIAECPSKEIQYPYELEDSITTKVEALAKKIYRAGRVEYTAAAKKALKRISEWNLEGLPVCVAKTQYSFSDDAKKLNVPEGYTFTVRDFVINTGSGMIVAIAGDIMRMPNLPSGVIAIHAKAWAFPLDQYLCPFKASLCLFLISTALSLP